MDDREHALNRVLVQFAANLCTEFSVQDILDHLVASIVELLPVSGAGVMTVDSGDDLHFVAASDDVIRTIQVLQRETVEGPCLEAHRSGRACALDDLTAPNAFPEFSRRALDSGMSAVFSFPLRTGGLNLGALDLYRATPGPLTADDVHVAAVLADVAAAYLVNARSRADSSLAMADLSHRSLHDPLTGLPNRTLLAELLNEAMNRASRSRRRIAVLFLDLDDFKAVNDRHGHHVGDQLLIAVSARLTAALRPGDVLARLGGDEFVAVCEDLPDGSRAADVSHRLLSAMTRPFHLQGYDLALGASIGIALSDRRRLGKAQELLAAADAAMYEAKRAGGGRHHLHRASIPTLGMSRPTSRDSLVPETPPIDPGRWGVEASTGNERYATVYQPIVNVHDDSVLAVETLLRWRLSTPGAPLPEAIVGEAERSGAILELGDWVLRQACRDSYRWRVSDDGQPQTASHHPMQPSIRTSVNVSAQQITGPAFLRRVERALTDTGADPSSIALELTESAALPDDRRTVDVLRSLKELGLQLWLDDFGSGYSSLNYLRVFPLDAVKIDPSFAHRLSEDKASRAIIASTIAMCHELGMTVIVEGVENALELQAAIDLGTDACQGFYLGRPMSADALAAAAYGGLDTGHTRATQPTGGATPRHPVPDEPPAGRRAPVGLLPHAVVTALRPRRRAT